MRILVVSLVQLSSIFIIRYSDEIALAPTPASDGGVPIAPEGELIYIEQIHTMREYELTTLYIDYGHILQRDDVLADAIQKQYYRFLPYIRRAVHNLVAEFEPEYLKLNPTAAATDSINLQSREFSVAFYHLPLVSGIRELRTDKIGTLMSISGTVTRTSEVRPELLYGSFICEICGGLVNEIEQQFKYTEVCISRFNCFARTHMILQAESMSQPHLWKPQFMAATNRQLKVYRLAESPYPRKPIRDSDGFHASLARRNSSRRTC